MSTRPLQILQRFPAHLEPARPDKQLWSVVEALAADLDVLSSELAGVRRAHRLKDADTLRDLLLLAGLHGLDRTLPAILFMRAAQVRLLAKQLDQAATAGDATTRNARAKSLFELWATPDPGNRLALYSPPGPPDLNAAAHALATAARASVSSRRLLEGTRTRLAQVCQTHRRGNATLRAVLEAAANALDLDIDEAKNAEVMDALQESPNDTVDLDRMDGFFHSLDRYRHVTHVRDRLQPDPPPALPYQPELLGIEENPMDPSVSTGEGPGNVGPKANQALLGNGLFEVMRRGFANEKLKIEIEGMNGRTRKLQFVHRDEGRGLCFAGTVPNGSKLVIDEQGKFTLDGVDVDDMAFTWEGGCFGDSTDPSPRDWAFGGPHMPPGVRTASFAKTTPPGMLDASATFPHPRVPLLGAGISIGLNRFAIFVDPAAGDAGAPPEEVADITLSWIERMPYVFKIWIPARFAALDPPAPDEGVLQKLDRALDRFRPMGVEVQTAYTDTTWAQLVAAMLTPAP